MDLKLGPLRQVALSCSDLRKFIEYYRDTLGLELIAEFTPPGLAFFRLGSTRLMLEQHATNPGAHAVLYFEVADVAAAQATLEARGVRFSSQPHRIHRDDTGTFGPAGAEEWMTFFEDPDGNILALAESRLPSAVP
jgi:catechol 2,3-dioxygenase-like lactoylglutathione lyase family enzyme